MFRAQFDNIYPLKRVFQDPRPSYVVLEPEGRGRHALPGPGRGGGVVPSVM